MGGTIMTVCTNTLAAGLFLLLTAASLNAGIVKGVMSVTGAEMD
jgi:hypothetical protein